MKTLKLAFKKGRGEIWTPERLGMLDRKELLHLRANAERLSEPELVVRCDEMLKDRPARGGTRASSRQKAHARLIPRSKAFEARGVWLQDVRTSWSGVRKSDGAVVFAMWARAVEAKQGGCTCLLWAPNVEGARPWSDTVAGRERLHHCELALGRGGAEGFLVHGDAMEGRLPEDRARSVFGIDPETVIHFRVDRRGEEYWAAWGKAAS
jgi:hypothetical protein